MNVVLSSRSRTMTATRTIKRAADVVGSLMLLILMSPVAGAIALAIRVQMGKPVLFVQARPGLDEVPFGMLKFRTMSDERGPDGRQRPDRERMTKLGRILRSTSLDELPQLVNVLKGEMSFVGPRPLLIQYLPYFNERERLRFSVRPGITGLAQIKGRNALRWTDRLALDVWYVERLSVTLDLRIIAGTIWAILCRQGFEADPEAHMMNLDQERASEQPCIQ